MKEDINNLKEIVDLCEKEIKNNNYNTTATLDITDLKSIDNLLNELDRLQKENEKLKEKRIDPKEYGSMKIRLANSIPKSVIEDKIDVLEKIQKEFPNNEILEVKIIAYKELLEKE